MLDHHVPRTECPVCNHALDAATSPFNQALPKEGDFTLCFYCSSILTFGPGLSLLETTDEDIARLSDEFIIELNRVRSAVTRARKAVELKKISGEHL